MTKAAIGVDIGGTRTKSGLVHLETGEVLNMIIHPTEKDDEGKFLERIGHAIKEHQSFSSATQTTIVGIGFGVPSFVNSKGMVDSTYGFLPFMENYPLVQRIENQFGLSCRIDNDARVVALGEALYGEGKGFERVLVMTLGTGLGLGFVKQGKFQDELPYAHMGGHISVTDDDQQCYCGKTGCLESLVSSAGILYTGEQIKWKEKYRDIPLTAESIFKSAEAGNADAQIIVQKLVKHLRTGIYNYINLFAPGIVVIGGGIGKGLKPYLQKLTENTFLKPYQDYGVKITVSTLQEHAGILGSAALFHD